MKHYTHINKATSSSLRPLSLLSETVAVSQRNVVNKGRRECIRTVVIYWQMFLNECFTKIYVFENWKGNKLVLFASLSKIPSTWLYVHI